MSVGHVAMLGHTVEPALEHLTGEARGAQVVLLKPRRAPGGVTHDARDTLQLRAVDGEYIRGLRAPQRQR